MRTHLHREPTRTAATSSLTGQRVASLHHRVARAVARSGKKAFRRVLGHFIMTDECTDDRAAFCFGNNRDGHFFVKHKTHTRTLPLSLELKRKTIQHGGYSHTYHTVFDRCTGNEHIFSFVSLSLSLSYPPPLCFEMHAVRQPASGTSMIHTKSPGPIQAQQAQPSPQLSELLHSLI